MTHELEKRKVLIVEDDEPTQEAIFLKFRQLGYGTDRAGNGQEGLEKLQTGNYSCVLLDLRMPKTDGFVFLEKRQMAKEMLSVPVVVFSNFSQPEFVDRAIKLGANGYLVKAQHSVQSIVDEVLQCLEKNQCQIDR